MSSPVLRWLDSTRGRIVTLAVLCVAVIVALTLALVAQSNAAHAAATAARIAKDQAARNAAIAASEAAAAKEQQKVLQDGFCGLLGPISRIPLTPTSTPQLRTIVGASAHGFAVIHCPKGR